MKTIYLIFATLLFSSLAFANESLLNGKITDDYGKSLERAWVLVLDADDMSYVTGTVTDAHGYFEIQNVEEGNYILSVHHVTFDEPKTLGTWNAESDLNGISYMLQFQNDSEIIIEYNSREEITYYAINGEE